MLLPIALPKDKPLSPFLAATTLVTNSGSEVPIDTTVKPINVSLNPSIAAICFALSTVMSPPQMMHATPITI